jgi:hypothetical protein
MPRGKVGSLLWTSLKSIGSSGFELIRSCTDPLCQMFLPGPTKGRPCEISGPKPFARSSSLLVDPGDICPLHGPTVDTMDYIVSSGHVAAPVLPTWRDQALFTTWLKAAAWTPRLHTVVRGTPDSGYRQG